MTSYKYLILISIGLCFGNTSFGQDFVYGKVVDENGQALYSAEVYWDAKNETNRNKQLTGPDGTFKIEMPKDTTIALVVYVPGKETIEKFLSESEYNEFILVEMKEKGITSVTASRWEQSVYDVPASTVIISREEIAQNGYMTLQEILENVPGLFAIDHRTENGITLGVRGFWSDVNRNVMIQVNGVNMISERWMDFGFDKINVAVEAIDKIEIVRGPMNVIYGSGAFFGVINIITNENQNRNSGIVSTGFGLQSINDSTMSAGFGPSGIQKNFFSYSARGDGFDFSINAMTYQRGGFSENWDDMILDTTYNLDDADTSLPANAITISDYKGGVIRPWRYSKHHQALNLSVGYNGFFADINYAASNFGVSFYGHPGPGDRNDYRSFTGNCQFGYRGGTSNDRFNYQAKVAYMKSNTFGEMKYVSDNSFSYGEDRCATVRAEFNTRTSLIESNVSTELNLDLLAGIYFSRNFENNSFYNLPFFSSTPWYTGLLPGSNVDTKAAYLQTELKIENWIVVGGIRAEHEGDYVILNSTNGGSGNEIRLQDTVYGDSKPSIIPRLAVIYKKSSDNGNANHYFRAMYGQAFREPNAPKNAGDVMVPNYNDSTNTPYLGPEEITTYELGYTFVNEPIGIELNANLFLNDLYSLIVTKSILEGDKFKGISENTGKRRTYGVELIAKKSFSFSLKNNKSIRLKTSISGTYQKTISLDSTNRNLYLPSEPSDYYIDSSAFSFSPPVLGTANITGSYKNFSLGISANYVGKMFAHYKDSYFKKDSTFVPGEFIGEQTDDYFRFSTNFRLDNIRFFNEETGGFYFNLKISNLLNTRYRYPTYNTVTWATKGILGRGRQFLLSIGYNF